MRTAGWPNTTGGWGVAGLRLVYGSLAVVMAANCSNGGASLAPSVSSSASLATTTWPVRGFEAQDQVDFPDEDTITVRFVTYGDVDLDDDIPFGMIPDVQIAVIRERELISAHDSIRHLDDWWMTVGGNDAGIDRRIFPGVRVQSTAEKLAAAPARFVATGSDGKLEISIDYTDDGYYAYSFCVISPDVDDLIAGCNYRPISLWKYGSSDTTVYVYLTHGYAIVEEGLGGEERYQRFLEGEILKETATVSIVAIRMDDVAPPQPDKGMKVAIVNDAYVSDWWEATLDEKATGFGMNRVIYFSSEVLAHDWIHVVTTGPDGLAEIDLPSGDYLVCKVTNTIDASYTHIGGCSYDTLLSARNNFFKVISSAGGNHTSIEKMSEEEGERAIARVRSWYIDELPE